jgi:3-methyl-2-oxobutanoate hydroxymethyltransferase
MVAACSPKSGKRAAMRSARVQSLDAAAALSFEIFVSIQTPIDLLLGLIPLGLASNSTRCENMAEGKETAEQEKIYKDALALEKAGCFAIVLECVPMKLAEKITKALSIPTIGIGAGKHCDGQVLVLQDLLGMSKDFKPKFLRTYMNGFDLIKSAFNDFHHSVSLEEFPSDKESYT